jgi:hypothetical protein
MSELLKQVLTDKNARSQAAAKKLAIPRDTPFAPWQ